MNIKIQRVTGINVIRCTSRRHIKMFFITLLLTRHCRNTRSQFSNVFKKWFSPNAPFGVIRTSYCSVEFKSLPANGAKKHKFVDRVLKTPERQLPKYAMKNGGIYLKITFIEGFRVTATSTTQEYDISAFVLLNFSLKRFFVSFAFF